MVKGKNIKKTAKKRVIKSKPASKIIKKKIVKKPAAKTISKSPEKKAPVKVKKGIISSQKILTGEGWKRMMLKNHKPSKK